MKTLSVGAEAVIYLDKGDVIKARQPKEYRQKDLDRKLRLHRMRREVKVIEALMEIGVNVPGIIYVDERKTSITMQLVDGKKVRDILSESNYKSICTDIGKAVGIMHSKDIIHGDLTTSNMILNKKKLFFIDFGLSLFSKREEDKAVDLHLFKQALNSSHHQVAEDCFKVMIKAYKKTNSDWKDVLERLEKVESRGRYKGKK
jgi:Kae1-associated kinase Bud32